MKNLFYWSWCLPQTLLGWLLLNFLLNEIKSYDVLSSKTTVILFSHKLISSFALGKYIFLNFKDKSDPYVLKHELGHCKQSRILGPFYLFTVGILSVFWNIAGRIKPELNKNYYKRWPENWADELGEITHRK